MNLSFIVVTYGRGEPLQGCLTSIYRQRGLPSAYEVILIDNKGEAQVQRPPHPEISLRVERSTRNLGVSGGRNLGIELAQGADLVFIDDDAIWHTPDDVARLLTCLNATPGNGAVGVKVIDPQDQSIIVNFLPHPNKQYALSLTAPAEAPYFYGGGNALKASAIREVGPYPARFFYAMEEIDLSLRLIDGGYKIWFEPSVAIYHPRSTSVKGTQYWKQNTLNKSRVALRLLPFPYTLTVPLIWSFAALLKTRSLGVVLQIWRALWAERALLRHERNPIRRETVGYLKRIGARLLF